MVQPPHFLTEVAAVLARKTPETTRENLLDLQLLYWESVESSAIHETTIDLSIELRHHLFDTLPLRHLNRASIFCLLFTK